MFDQTYVLGTFSIILGTYRWKLDRYCTSLWCRVLYGLLFYVRFLTYTIHIFLLLLMALSPIWYNCPIIQICLPILPFSAPPQMLRTVVCSQRKRPSLFLGWKAWKNPPSLNHWSTIWREITRLPEAPILKLYALIDRFVYLSSSTFLSRHTHYRITNVSNLRGYVT